jgi:hypothetical protein
LRIRPQSPGSGFRHFPTKIAGSLRRTLKIPVFGRRRPETGFDLHCLAYFAVKLAKFSTLAAGKMGMRASTGLQTWSIRLASALSAVTNFGKCHIALHGRGRSDASVAIATNTDGTASKLPNNIVVVADLDHALGEHRIGTPGAGQAPGWRPTVERRDFQRNGSARAAASLRESPAAFRAPLVRSQRLRDGAGEIGGAEFQIFRSRA